MMKLGVSTLNITPEMPLNLAGFSFRKSNFENVAHPIHLRCQLFEDQFALISLELLFVGEYLTDKVHAAANKVPELKHLSIILTATHTHSSFQTADHHSPQLGECNSEYCTFLVGKIIDALRVSLKSSEEVTVEHCVSECNIGIYRRKLTDDGQVLMAPNTQVKIDDSANIFIYKTKQNSIKGILVHNHCHPTISADNSLSSEYPGVVSMELERAFNTPSCLFLQGFCGDIRPNLSKDGETFYRGTIEDIEHIGTQLAQTYADSMRNYSVPVSSRSDFSYKTTQFQLPTTWGETKYRLHTFTTENDKSTIEYEWAKHTEIHFKEIENRNGSVTCKATYLDLHKTIKLLFINAEVVNEYQQYINQHLDSDLLCVGYSDGMLGYIPTKQQIHEGGYEAADSAYYFYLPAPFSSEVEAVFKNNIKALLG